MAPKRMSDSQLSLITPPRARARKSDPWTSHLAAEGVNVTETQKLVLMAFMRGPATDFALYERIRAYWPDRCPTPQSVRSRRAELVLKGLVEDSGEVGLSEHGGKSKVWKRVAT